MKEERQLKKKIVLCYFGKLYHPLIVQFPKILHQNKICWKYLCVAGGCARTKLLAGGQESSIRSWWTFFGKHTYLLLLIYPQWAKKKISTFFYRTILCSSTLFGLFKRIKSTFFEKICDWKVPPPKTTLSEEFSFSFQKMLILVFEKKPWTVLPQWIFFHVCCRITFPIGSDDIKKVLIGL